MMESYVKRGAKIKPEIRVAMIEAVKPRPSDPIKAEVYDIAIANLRAAWARRWFAKNGFHI